MNKQEVIKAIANKKNLTQKVVQSVIDGLEEVSKSEIKKGRKVQLTGFLTIRPVYRKPRQGFDPKNNVTIPIGETVGLSVKPSDTLKECTKKLNVEKFRPKATKAKVEKDVDADEE